MNPEEKKYRKDCRLFTHFNLYLHIFIDGINTFLMRELAYDLAIFIELCLNSRRAIVYYYYYYIFSIIIINHSTEMLVRWWINFLGKVYKHATYIALKIKSVMKKSVFLGDIMKWNECYRITFTAWYGCQISRGVFLVI